MGFEYTSIKLLFPYLQCELLVCVCVCVMTSSFQSRTKTGSIGFQYHSILMDTKVFVFQKLGL